MKTIGIFTSGYGHESIALAIEEKIKDIKSNDFKIKIYKRTDNLEVLDLIYKYAYKFNPSLTKHAFILSENLIKNKKNKELVRQILFQIEDKKVQNFIKKNKIDLCISTYFTYNPSLIKSQKELGLPFINVIPDPKTIHPMIVDENARVNIVFDSDALKKFSDLNIKPAGWFVRNKFEASYDQKQVKKELKIEDQFTVLIVSGSEGANAILKILPSIINCDKKVNFIVACGKNKFLYNNVLGIKQSLEKLSSSKAKLIPLAFTKNLHQYMQAADLVIGKAGPNTLFESVATETPFFAITHIHGQEDGNLDIIKDYQLGFVEENATKANRKLTAILRKPEVLHKFAPHLQALKKYNQQAGQVLMEEIKRLLA